MEGITVEWPRKGLGGKGSVGVCPPPPPDGLFSWDWAVTLVWLTA